MRNVEEPNKRETVFDWLGQIFLVFGIEMMCMVVFCTAFGERAKSYSTMFELGKDGVSISIMLQYFLMAVIIITLKFLFFTDMVIKKMSVTLRTILMFTSVVIALVAFVIIFGWFPANDWEAWAMCAACFIISAGLSTFISALREKSETKKMQEALERIKGK